MGKKGKIIVKLPNVLDSVPVEDFLSSTLGHIQEDLVSSIGGDDALNPLSKSLPYWDEFQEFVLKNIKDSPIKDKVVAYLYKKFVDYKNARGRKASKHFFKVKEYMENVNKKFSEIKHSELQEIIRNYILNDKDASYIHGEVETAVKLNDFDISSCIERIKNDFSIWDCYNLLSLSHKIEKIPLKNFKQFLKDTLETRDYMAVEQILNLYYGIERLIKLKGLYNNEQFLDNLDKSILDKYNKNHLLHIANSLRNIYSILNNLDKIEQLFKGVDLDSSL